MGKRLYVGNLSYSVTEDQLRNLFEQVGATEKVTVITDRESGRSKGFGFVEMATDELAEEAIKRLNGTSFVNRTLTVNEAKPREERPAGGGSRGGFSRGDSYGGGRDSYGGGRDSFGGGRDSYGGSRGDRDFGDRGYGRGDRDRRDRY